MVNTTGPVTFAGRPKLKNIKNVTPKKVWNKLRGKEDIYSYYSYKREDRFETQFHKMDPKSFTPDDKADMADEAVYQIDDILSDDRVPSRKDVAMLKKVQQVLGPGDKRHASRVDLTHPEHPDQTVRLDGDLLDGMKTLIRVPEKISTRFPKTKAKLTQEQRKQLSQLKDTLAAMAAASRYQPYKSTDLPYELEIHNYYMANHLKPRYERKEFDEIFQLCKDDGAFQLNIDDKTGLVRTAGIDADEDDIMSQGWVTDTIRNGELQRQQNPESWRMAMETLAHFYHNERPAFEQVFNNPQSYREFGTGVHHMFNPETGKRYPWLNSKRLESHGLAMTGFCKTITAGLTDKAPYGYLRGYQVPDEMLDAVANLARYFSIIDYPNAPSIGPWEELTFDGLTSDTETIRQGFETLHDMLYNPNYNQNLSMAKIRRRLLERPDAKWLSRENLEHQIEIGRQKVLERVSGTPTEHPDRPADVGLAFVTTSTINLAPDGKNPVEDAKAHLKILDSLSETVVRRNGVIRYPEFEVQLKDGSKVKTYDGYLTPNWGLAADSQGKLSFFRNAWKKKFGKPYTHLEPSTPEGFTARAKHADAKGKEAEWFMIGEMARGYSKQLSKLLHHLQVENRAPNAEEKQLLKHSLDKATEMMNRSLARITDWGTKANGKHCPSWSVPEAYQHVSTFDGKTRMMPGVNTPLAWAASCLYGAMKEYRAALGRLELTGLAGKLDD